ncbi:MAG: SDR family NAD(P)-dependent oxidoreductase [Planctomycetes bacterium]|nr:SDR family NAD(P)-dependent oxidoreductase [Planctomycetota bacterium]
MKLNGKRTVITGASSGIGRALAAALAGRGAAVVLAARREDRLNEAAEKIAQEFPDAPKPLALRCDVTDVDSIKALINRCEEDLGGIDIWINNAGVGVYGSNEKTSMEELRWTMDVNFFGAAQCMFEVLPLMRRQGAGLIVNVSSISALHGVPYMGVYAASKAALANLSQSLRAELCDTPIRIMIVYPGYTQTEFFEKEKNVGGGRRPDGPYASVEDVGEAIARGIERGKQDLIIPFQGKAMKLSEGLAPWIVEREMRKLARRLREG